MLIVDTEGRTYQIIESAALTEVFEQGKPGMHIRLEHLGMRKSKKGRAFHAFGSELWIEEGETYVNEKPKSKGHTPRKARKD
jgi:hypothetical protein